MYPFQLQPSLSRRFQTPIIDRTGGQGLLRGFAQVRGICPDGGHRIPTRIASASEKSPVFFGGYFTAKGSGNCRAKWPLNYY